MLSAAFITRASQMVLVVKNPPADAGNVRLRFNPWVRKIPWRKAWQPTPVFVPGESHRQRSLAVYSPWGHKESDRTEPLSTHTSKGPFVCKLSSFQNYVIVVFVLVDFYAKKIPLCMSVFWEGTQVDCHLKSCVALVGIM